MASDGSPHPPPRSRIRVRDLLIQIAVLLAVAAVLAALSGNAYQRLAERGIASGFGFLEVPAGFDIIVHLIPYDETSSYGRALLVSILNTLSMAVLAVILSTVVGVLVGIARVSVNGLLRLIATVYIETIRNIPPLLQIFFWYFAVLRTLPPVRESIAVGEVAFLNNRGLFVPSLSAGPGGGLLLAVSAIGAALAIAVVRWARRRRRRTGKGFPTLPVAIALTALPPLVAIASGVTVFEWTMPELKGFNFQGGLVLIPEFLAVLVALVIYTSSFIAEIVRAGIQSVHRHQVESARALGLTPVQTLRLVIIPLAMRTIIPPLTSQYLNVTKNTSLGSAVAYPELVAVFTGTVLNQTGQAVETIAIAMAVYLVLSLTISGFMNWRNRKSIAVGR